MHNVNHGLKIESDIKIASTIPASFYMSNDWFEISKEKIFASSWQFCTDTNQLAAPGSVVPITLLPGMLDEPIIFTRDGNDMLHCLSNVCTHRGKVLVEKACQADKIKCGYHGRRFDLCGKFLHMPAFEKALNFPTSKDNLPKVPFAKLGHFLFASINPNAPFDDIYGDIKKRLFWLPFEQMRFDPSRSRDYTVKAHWALYCENYLEGLHIPFVHKALRSVLDFQHYQTEIYRYANLQFALANADEDSFDLPPSSPDYGKRVAAYYYWIFPNIMLNFYPWGCSVNIVKPVSSSLTLVSFLSYVLDENKLDKGAGAELDLVEREDEAVVESVQQGIRSRFYQSGRYSPSMEQGTHHFHQLLCEFLNK